MIYPIGGCSTRPIVHVAGADAGAVAGAVADTDEIYGAYAAAEIMSSNNINNLVDPLRCLVDPLGCLVDPLGCLVDPLDLGRTLVGKDIGSSTQ